MFTQNSSTPTRDAYGEYQVAPASPATWSTHWQSQSTPTRMMEKKPAKKAAPLNDRPGPAWLLISTLVAAAIAADVYFVQQGHAVGTIAAPILLIPALHGIWRGGMRKILMLPVLL